MNGLLKWVREGKDGGSRPSVSVCLASREDESSLVGTGEERELAAWRLCQRDRKTPPSQKHLESGPINF